MYGLARLSRFPANLDCVGVEQQLTRVVSGQQVAEELAATTATVELG